MDGDASNGAERTAAPANGSQRPFVLVVPDSFGSHLRNADGRTWLDLVTLAGDGVSLLSGEPTGSDTHDGVIAALYGPLVGELEAKCDVDAFDYDWRAPARVSAKALARTVRDILANGARPVHLLAHGAGALVAFAMLADDSEVRAALAARKSRVITLGAPIGGSFDVARMLLGQHPLIELIAGMTNGELDSNAVAKIFCGWPGLVEQLPFDARSAAEPHDDASAAPATRNDTTGSAAWASFIDKAMLEQAAEFRAWLSSALTSTLAETSVRQVFAIAGTGVTTAAAVSRSPSPTSAGSAGATPSAATFLYTTGGDGRVVADAAHCPGARRLFVEASHAEFISNGDLAKAYLDLLLLGQSIAFSSAMRAAPDAPAPGRREPVTKELPTSVDVLEAASGALARRASIVFPLRVSVVHGHLRQARFPVAVGHYRGDSMLSAEDALDQALGGSLRRRFDLGMYPGPEGTLEVVRRSTSHPPGAIVIGLGSIGELTSTSLHRLVTAAVLRYALEIADQFEPGSSWQSAAFSTLLLGTGGGASVSLTDCITSIVRAALDVNRQLRQTRQWDRVRVDRIEFVELFEDMGAQAARTVTQLPILLAEDLAGNESIDAAATMETRPGGEFNRPSNPYRWGWWRRIQVKAQSGQEAAKDASARNALVLQFSAVSDIARLEVESTVQNQQQVWRLVDEAMGLSEADLKLSNTLYELLVPPGIKNRIRQGGDLMLQLDSEAARYPFETMAERVGDRLEPLVIRYGLLRQLEMIKSGDDPLAATGLNMLIVGAPTNVLPLLPGARTEAFHVDSLARELGWTPTPMIDRTGREILTELFARDYRILHFAAHGIHDADPLKSGVVIGPDDFLTATHVRSLPVVPELVFLNCCHSGQLGDSRRAVPFPQLAASLAEGFMKVGTRAVIAAGWAVDDEAALTFATTFYRLFLAGQPFGQAVQEARRAVYKTRGTTNTWGAYQCYGDSQYRLRIPRSASRASSTSRAVSRRELIAELRSIASQAGGATSDTLVKLSKRFDELRAQLIDSWKDGEILAEFAATAAELGGFHDAIDLYRQALRSPKALMPLRAVEQLANILSRSAPGIGDATDVTAAETDQVFDEAKEWLDWLDAKLEPTRERRALRGAVYKRWALRANGEQQRQRRLEQSRKAYADARGLAGGDDSYQILNWIALRFLLEPRARKELRSLAEQEWERAKRSERQASEPDFWQRIAVPDALLHVALCSGTIDGRLKEIQAAYAFALSTGPSARELASVRDHIEFLATMVPVCCNGASPEMTRALSAIAASLTT